MEPADQIAVVTAGATTTVVGTFSQRGSLSVTTNPPLAAQISVDGVPRNDWGMWTDLPAGSDVVCFGAVAGYIAPACQDVTVNTGALTVITGTYTVNSAANGAVGLGFLRVTTSPPLPSQISLNGVVADSWGLNWLELAPGSYTVHFSHVEGYMEPADQIAVVTAGATTTVVGTFSQRGSLSVTTNPPLAAQISVDGVPRNDWGMWTDLPAGSDVVCFGAVAGYIAPACQDVTVNTGALTVITGTYTVGQ